MASELERLHERIDEIEVAMMTTRRADGHLQSRPMATQRRAEGADLWFATAEGTSAVEDVEGDPHVNLAYYNDRTREWVSVAGLASLSRDRAKIHELYAPGWKIWFSDECDARHGTADDPRIVLVAVEIHEAAYLELDCPMPVARGAFRSRRVASLLYGPRVHSTPDDPYTVAAPVTARSAPLIDVASSEQRNATATATSSGRINRPCGRSASTRATISS